MYLKLLLMFNDGTIDEIVVKRVSNLSSTSKFFYFEKPTDDKGMGVCILKSDIKCWEVLPNG